MTHNSFGELAHQAGVTQLLWEATAWQEPEPSPLVSSVPTAQIIPGSTCLCLMCGSALLMLHSGAWFRLLLLITAQDE